MPNESHELPLPQDSQLQIKQDDKFFSKLMSKETSMANSSTRVYYGGASGAVPFNWETRPGTPKHTLFTDTSLPPLTPPPSYYSKSKSLKKSSSKSNKLLSNIVPRLMTHRRSHVTPSTTSWSSTSFSSSSSSSWSSLSPKTHQHHHHPHRCRHGSLSCCSRSFPINFNMDVDVDDDGDDHEHGHQHKHGKVFSGGCYPLVKMKHALLSIVGSHGSGRGTA